MTRRRTRQEALARREALVRLAALAVLPVLAGAAPAGARAEGAPFRPPSGPMRFTRRLRRDLGDGAAIEVVRSFDIRFAPAPGGWLVDGAQSSARVTAPPSLAAFARLEEQRQETSLFPLTLDAAGRIVAGPQGAEPADFAPVVDEAFAWLRRNRLPAATQSAAREFVVGLATVAARITAMPPADLFTGGAPMERVQDLTMPDGAPGKVSVFYHGRSAPGVGLLQFGERTVITDAAGSRRLTVEQWTLEPLPEMLSR